MRFERSFFAATFAAWLLSISAGATTALAGEKGPSVKALKNFTYNLPDQSCSFTPVKLRNGLYNKSGDAAVFGRACFGDLNGDGLTDAAVHLGWQPDGYAWMQHVVFLCQVKGRLIQVADYCLDDNETVKTMTISGNKVTVETDLSLGHPVSICSARLSAAGFNHPDAHKVTEFGLRRTSPKSQWNLVSRQFQIDPASGKLIPWVDMTGYVCAMEERLKQNWQPTSCDRSETVTGSFSVDNKGRVSALSLETSAEAPGADASALEAIMVSQPFAPLPIGAGQQLHVSFRMDAGSVSLF